MTDVSENIFREKMLRVQKAIYDLFTSGVFNHFKRTFDSRIFCMKSAIDG